MKKVIPFTKEIQFKTMIGEITDITVEHTLKVMEENTIEGDFLVHGTYKMTEASQIEEDFDYKLPFTIEMDPKYDLMECKISISDFYFEIINEEILKVNIEVELSEITEKSILEEVRAAVEEEKIAELVREDEKEPIAEENLAVEGLSLSEETIRMQLEKVEPVDPMMKEEDFSESFMKESAPIIEDLDAPQEKEEVQPIEVLDVAPIEKVAKVVAVETKAETLVEESTSPKASVSSIFSAISNTEETFSTYHVYIVREMDTVDSIVEKYKTTREDLSHYNDLNEVKIGTKLIIPCNNE